MSKKVLLIHESKSPKKINNSIHGELETNDKGHIVFKDHEGNVKITIIEL